MADETHMGVDWLNVVAPNNVPVLEGVTVVSILFTLVEQVFKYEDAG